MTALVAAVCAVFGLAVGSFLNVVVWRVPRRESLVRPRSRCPDCGKAIPARDNIPVVSWLALGGRCRHCGWRIPVRYPLTEAGCALLWALVAVRFGPSWLLPAYLVLTAALLALSVIDLEHYLLPNRIVYPLWLAELALLAAGVAGEGLGWSVYGRALAGGAVAYAAFFLLHFAYPKGMGFGDVKLSFALGLGLGLLGWGELVLGFFTGFLLGAAIGIVLLATRRRGRKDPVPFGPFLAAGAVIAILWGGPILDLYRG